MSTSSPLPARLDHCQFLDSLLGPQEEIRFVFPMGRRLEPGLRARLWDTIDREPIFALQGIIATGIQRLYVESRPPR